MQLPKLTPLQSRLLASAIATCLLVTILVFFPPHRFVYAAEIPVPGHVQYTGLEESTLPSTLLDDLSSGGDQQIEEERSDGVYAPDFSYFDRSLVGRQQSDVEKLNNDQKKETDINPGSTKNFVFEKSQLGGKRARSLLAESPAVRGLENTSGEESTHAGVLSEEDLAEEEELRKRQAGSQVWISANSCRQPEPTVNLITGDIPQLTLYVSTSSKNTKPGPSATNDLAHDPIPFVGGYANFSVQTDTDLFIGVSAPSLTQGWNGSWNFEVAASVDGYFHRYNDTNQFIYMIDTDSDSALFITYNLTKDNNSTDEVERWKKMKSPFTMYTFPNGTWTPVTGLERSYCGLKEQFNTTNNITVESSITTKFGQGLPKGQFHVQGLENGKTYTGFLAVSGSDEDLQLPDEGVVRGGGQVFQQFSWTTKADDSCQVIFDLEFCSDVAYAVPSSETFKSNDSALMALYDNQAKDYFKNFTNSLDQVACDTTSTAQYSLARNCTDCSRDYKSWLCSVLIPRCEDWSAKDDWLQERNINARLSNGSLPYEKNMTLEFNSTKRERFAFTKSRNPLIDDKIKPGPYKELLPCEDLCFDIVRSCPAQLGFACPNSPARLTTYGQRDPIELKCNFPGAVVSLNIDRGAAGTLTARFGIVVLVAVLAAAWSWI